MREEIKNKFYKTHSNYQQKKMFIKFNTRIKEVKMIDNNVFRDVSYGLYIISTKYNGKNVGCVINTLSQVTSENPVVSFSVNKNNYTNEAIKNTKKFAVSIISEKTKKEVITKFGYNSSRDTDKFENCAY